jgi:hypothetical protein
MKLERTYLKPKFGTFLKYFTLLLISFWVFVTMIQIFTSSNPLDSKLPGWTISMILLPLSVSIGLTLGTRKFQLIITNPNDLNATKESILKFLLKNGLTIKEKSESEITLESNKFYNRIFNNWFQLETVLLKDLDNKVIVDGPFRLVDRLADAVDSKLRFGKSLD